MKFHQRYQRIHVSIRSRLGQKDYLPCGGVCGLAPLVRSARRCSGSSSTVGDSVRVGLEWGASVEQNGYIYQHDCEGSASAGGPDKMRSLLLPPATRAARRRHNLMISSFPRMLLYSFTGRRGHAVGGEASAACAFRARERTSDDPERASQRGVGGKAKTVGKSVLLVSLLVVLVAGRTPSLRLFLSSCQSVALARVEREKEEKPTLHCLVGGSSMKPEAMERVCRRASRQDHWMQLFVGCETCFRG